MSNNTICHRTDAGHTTVWLVGEERHSVLKAEGEVAHTIAVIMMGEIMKGVKKADHAHLPSLVRTDDQSKEQSAKTIVAFARFIVAAAKISVDDTLLPEVMIKALEESLRRAEVRCDAKDYSKKLYTEVAEIFYFQGRTATDWKWEVKENWEEELVDLEEAMGLEGMGFEIVSTSLE